MRTILFTLLTLFSTTLFAQEGTFKGKDAAYWTDQLTKTESTENLQNRTRWYAGYALGNIGPHASASVDALCQRLLDVSEYEYTRAVCAWALGRIQDKKAIPSLIEALNSKMTAVRISTAQALGSFGEEANSATNALSSLLNGTLENSSESTELDNAPHAELIESVKAAVAAALWKISPADSQSAQLGKDALLSMIKKNSILNRLAALSELLSLAQDNSKDLTEFYKILALLLEKSNADDIARDCGTILMLQKQYEIVHGLLASENDVVRRRALRAICLYKEKVNNDDYKIPVESVLPLTESENPLTRAWTIRALGLAMNNKDAESAVVKAVEDDDPYVKKAARRALKN